MKIVMVLNTSWNVYNFRMGLLNALRNDGHEVLVLAPEDSHTALIREAGFRFYPVTMDSRGANPIKDVRLVFELKSLYKRIKPDIILHYTIKPNIYGTFAAAMLGIPVINNVCGLGTVFLKRTIVSRIAETMYKLAFRYPKKVFFQNDADLELFLKNDLVSKNITEVIPGSGINLANFLPANEYRRNDPFTFLVISRLITDKGILEYVGAARKLRSEGLPVRFQILGAMDPQHKRGIDPSIIESWVKDRTIEYLGTTDDVRQFISDADCIVLPSYREGTPRSLLEAASCAKPIIATDVPGCHHVVEHEYNGLLCTLKSADDLALKMKQMALADNETLQKFGENGRKKVESEFDEKIVIERYLHSIRELQ
ncbi:glycosyltransferase family 4 protein [Fulvivirga sedimenti]|uniref:Glycosyltransferase family 4 protein n=1 Tax=Fulvivirga sedimenti TaxID=2879465 RepID=A0A9X1HWA2_9BACT|nr:glycosyltransferase family 4 protein [Fulvivirga sedimenti]MCA6077952.1 glycosyltransferase family 4 protein [Fulvivirga sedimenti]